MAEASIVFRNQDMSGTGKIYVDTIEGAGALAARFRNAAHWVDVINAQDEVVHRWEKGNPDWESSDVLYYHNGFDSYDFVREGDGWWSPENRAQELSEMLAFTFDVATGRKEPSDQYCYLNLVADPDWTLSKLVDEAEQVQQATPTTNPENWAMAISNWMTDPTKHYLRYRVEHAALCIKNSANVPNCRVGRLGIELAEIEADFTSHSVNFKTSRVPNE